MNKDDRTERIRQAVTFLGQVIEDDRAEAGLTTLSFASVLYPERHVWLDSDLAGVLAIDLEDWNVEGAWDNAVARLDADDATAPGIVRAWLTGATIEECIELGARRSSRLL